MTKPQSDFLRMDCKFPLFVAGFGSGKSVTMATSIFNDLSVMTYVPIKIGAYAPTYDLLNLITIPYLSEFMEEAGIGFSLNKSSMIFTLETDDQIILRSMNNPARIVGYQTFRGHIDEADTLKEKQARDAWNKIIARNRQSVPLVDVNGNLIRHEEDFYYGPPPEETDGYDTRVKIADAGDPVLHMNRVSAYTTPEGFGFAYNTWEKEPAYGYKFVRASTRSNPHNPPDYIPQLMATYPEGLIEAYIEGKFVNLEGKSVYPKFSREDHDSNLEAKETDTLEIGMDFNVVHGASVAHILDARGNPVAVDEVHDAYDTDDQIAAWRQKYPKNRIHIYPDATGERRTSSNTTESDIAKLQNAGFKVFHNHVNPPIKDRVMSFNAMIMNGAGDIRYRVNVDKCPNLTNSLEKQIWGKNGLPDKSAGLDHIVDGAGYYVAYRHGISKPKFSTQTNLMSY
jgi:hypothetical protein